MLEKGKRSIVLKVLLILYVTNKRNMMKLSKRDIKQGYNGIKRMAQNAYVQGDYELSLEYIEKCATIAQQFNFVYTDDELEDLLKRIGGKTISLDKPDFVPIKGRVAFYDDFSVSFVLSLQYLEALVAANKEILYVTVDGKNSRFDGVIDKVKNYANIEIKVVHKTSRVQTLKSIFDAVVDFRPEKLLLHIYTTTRVVPALYRMPSIIDKYIINLADQTFWLGAGAVDYVLEFRQFGVSVSQQRRGIKPQQQLLIPFYPLADGNSFQGFPKGCQTDGKVLIFSGGDVYKVLDERRMYWHLVKRLLDTFPEVIFWFATKIEGKGVEFVKRFIAENHYEGRMFYTKFRPDINEVMAHADIFLGTCPVCGSLMSQLAAHNGTPILQYYYPGTPDDETEQAICINKVFQISYQDEEKFIDEAEKLIKDKEYRKRQGERLKEAMVSKEQFNAMVEEALETNKSPMALKPFEVNYKVLDDRWYELEKMGHTDTMPYLCGILGKKNTLRYVPIVFLKKQVRRIKTN